MKAGAAAAELEAGLARARGGLATFPAGLAGAFGRVTDEGKRGQGGVSLAIVTADGKTIAETRTSGEGYFAIQAPPGDEGGAGELHLLVATEPVPRTFHLTREGQPLALRRLLIETGTQESTRQPEPPRTQPETRTSTRPSTKKPAPPKNDAEPS